jgi:ABC-2 type transport system permease protein
MAVHSHAYRPYAGARTALWARPLVLTRYALADAFSRKAIIALLVLSALPALIAGSVIYLHHNLEALKMFDIPIDRLVRIDSLFFFRLLKGQALAAFLLTVMAGPRMLVSDLRDNALPLYLSRPLSRFEYLLGKALALIALGSLVTWVPTLLLIALQASLAGLAWLRANWWLPAAVVAAALAAVVLYTLLSLAIASVVRRKAASEAAVVAFFFVCALVGKVINETLRVEWGVHLSAPAMLEALWTSLFQLEQSNAVSVWAALVTIALFLVGASLVLERRVRAWEIVR